ncbi:hypothetical protein EsDP_00007038 [Epichloe bromicola]|uniref:Pantetheine-phosphate adenylyltransferase family protein n=1 Tax=Epichloe bromicola TaxID=79588 RepID=A0ABQ0CZF6_9HYPO
MPPSPGLTDAPSLLLLPCPPEPVTAVTVRAAYYEPLDSTISRLSNEYGSSTAGGVGPILVIAVASPVLTPERDNIRLVYWRRSQSILAEIYSLVASICAKRSIASDLEADDPGAVDIRVVLIDHSRASEGLYKPNSRGVYELNSSTILDLATFASTVHPWRQIFHPSSEQGYELLASFLKYSEGSQKLQHKQLVAVEGGLSLSNPAPALAADQAIEKSMSDACEGYSTVCLGGTFDHLHPGHKLFLHAAVLLLNVKDTRAKTGHQCELVIGISSDELLLKKKYAEELQSWDIRARSVINFLSTLLSTSTTAAMHMKAVQAETKELHARYRDGSILVRCVDFHDVYGPTVKEEAIEALVVSRETRSGGAVVNEKRRSQGWSELKVYEIDVLDVSFDTDNGIENEKAANNFAGKISSTEIRKQKAERRRTSS